MFDKLGGIARHHGPWLHIFHDNRTCAHDSPFSYGDSRPDKCFSKNPRLILYNDGLMH
jgi:hypothetical protein